MYCQHCGKEIDNEAEICVHCGCRVKNNSILSSKDTINIIRFCLTFFLGFIGSFIINHTEFKPKGWTCRTLAYFFLSIITFGIYNIVAAVCNFTFDENRETNIGYFKD